MHRFYLEPEHHAQAEILLTGREAHHALHVLRVRPGEQVIVLDGAGTELLCEIRNCDRREVRLAVVRRSCVPAPPWRVTLIQAIPKGKTFESIIQKGTELGVHRIIPLESERVVSHLDGGSAAAKREKWQATAIEAIKQCGSPWLPRIDLPMSPAEFLARRETFELALIASLQPGSRHAREYFRSFQRQTGRNPASLAIWIGPEGDFSPAEIEQIEAAGALPISLGPLVLRSETAAIYCLSILNHELQAPGRD